MFAGVRIEGDFWIESPTSPLPSSGPSLSRCSHTESTILHGDNSMAGFDDEKGLDIQQLVLRVKECGGRVGSICFQNSLQNSSEGNGIFATEELEAGQEVLTIPFHLCLAVDNLLTSPIGPIIEANPDLLNTPDEILCLGILYTLGHENSPWRSHVSTFPSAFNSTLSWSEEELRRLSPCSVFHLSKLMQSQLLHDWENIHLPLQQSFPDLLKAATYKNYIWAMSAVYSRAIGFTRDEEYIRCIPPLLDMANHTASSNLQTADTFRYSEENNTLSIIATKKLKAGEQCYAVYGEYPNAKLAFNYGFVILENPVQRIDIWTRLISSASFYPQKRALLEAGELTRNQTYDFTGTLINGTVSNRLLATIRIIQMTAEELSGLMYESPAVTGAMISIRNERATYLSLKALLTARLGPLDQYEVHPPSIN